MRIAPFIAFRYLFAKKSRNIINVISGISMLVVAAVSGAMITILSAFNGIDSLVESLFMNFDADLTVYPAKGRTFDCDSIPLDAIRYHDAVAHVSFTIEEDAILEYIEGKSVLTVKAVDENYPLVCPVRNSLREGHFLQFDSTWAETVIGYGVKMQNKIPFDPDRPPVIKLSAPVRGKKLRRDRENAFRTKAFNVAGVYSINAELDTKFALVSLHDGRTLYGFENEAGALEIKLKENVSLKKAKQSLSDLLGPDFAVKSRHEKNALVYQTNQSEKWAAFAMMMFILMIAAFNIMASLTMLVIEKKKDISVLLAMGATRASVRNIFFLEGIFINLIGAGAGLLLGLLLCWLQMTFGLIKLEGSIIPHYPVEVRWSDLLLVGMSVMLLALVSNWFLVRYLVQRHASTSSK